AAASESGEERRENSVAFSLPKMTAEAAAREARQKRNEGSTTATYGTPMSAAGPESVEPDTFRRGALSNGDDERTISKTRSAPVPEADSHALSEREPNTVPRDGRESGRRAELPPAPADPPRVASAPAPPPAVPNVASSPSGSSTAFGSSPSGSSTAFG